MANLLENPELLALGRAKLGEKWELLQPSTQARILEQLQNIGTPKKPSSKEMASNGHVVQKTKDPTVQAFYDFATKGPVVNIVRSNWLQRVVADAKDSSRPIETALFWGASDKPSVTPSDHQLVDKLVKLQHVTTQTHPPGLRLNIIFGDYHVVANGYGNKETLEINPAALNYLTEVRSLMTGRLEQTRVFWLSVLYEKYSLGFKNDQDTFSTDSEAKKVFLLHRSMLLSNAETHSVNGLTSEQSAINYVARRLREKVILSREFPNAVLLGTGIKKGAADIILPPNMPGAFSGDNTPWFQDRPTNQ